MSDTYGMEIQRLINRLPKGEGNFGSFGNEWVRDREAADKGMAERLSNTFTTKNNEYPFTVVVKYIKPGSFMFVAMEFPTLPPTKNGEALEIFKKHVEERITDCLVAPVSYKPEFLVGEVWTPNQQVFATYDEAMTACTDGMDAWKNVLDIRVIESDKEPNWAYDSEGKAINLRRVKK